jgi:hypothetical protein
LAHLPLPPPHYIVGTQEDG